MRTIKFRARRKNGKWVVGNFINHFSAYFNTEERHSIFLPKPENDNGGYWVEDIDPETVGQFTGLMDKNGKEIYEGDVIGCHNPRIKHLIFYNEKQGRFMAALNGDIENDFVGVCGLDDSRWTGSKEVIGNIYDNPDLLKGGGREMTLQDYTTEELRAELKCRNDLAKAEKAKVKRCRMCRHFGFIDIFGKKLTKSQIEFDNHFNFSRPCEFFRTKNGERFKCHKPSQPACEHFEPI